MESYIPQESSGLPSKHQSLVRSYDKLQEVLQEDLPLGKIPENVRWDILHPATQNSPLRREL